MKTLFTSHSLQLLGVAAASATLLSLLGSLYPAAAQTSIAAQAGQVNGRAVAQSIPGLQKITPQQRAAMTRASDHFNSQVRVLDPVIEQTHPVDKLAAQIQPLDLSGPTIIIKGHVPAIAATARKISAMAEDQSMTITFALKPRDQVGMDALVRKLYDSKDPLFHHFLTPAQRIARFSPTQEDFNKVISYARQMGLHVVDAAADRQSVKVTGTVKQIQNALNIHINNYQGSDGKSFYAPDQEPQVPQAVAPLLMGIERLSNADRPHPTALPGSPQGPKGSFQGAGSGGGGSVHPNDILEWDNIGIPAAEIQYCYDFDIFFSNSSGNIPINGAGQRIALVEYGDFIASDIQGYINYNANSNTFPTTLSAIPLQYHFNAAGDPGINTNTTECELDIEMVEAVADGINQLDIYEDADGTATTPLRSIVADDLDKQVSMSYEFDEDSMSPTTEAIIGGLTEEMAIQGQALFVSSGDYGAYGYNDSVLTVNAVAASPFATGVGGTTLALLGGANYGQWGWEYPWNSYNNRNATGGGISSYWGIPPYQINYFTSNNVAGDVSFSNRNVPDVAWDADPTTGVYAYIEGNNALLGGTSCGAPIWAAFWAQLNQTRALVGQSNIGFANPVLYADANSGRYATDFHDAYPGTNNYYYASTNYDDTTGLGSMNGLNLLIGLLYSSPYASAGELVGGFGTNDVSSGYSGQTIFMDMYMNEPVPLFCTATAFLYQVQNGSNVLVSAVALPAGGNYVAFSTPAPDVKTQTNLQYVVGVLYTDSNTGKTLGGLQYTNTLTLTLNPVTLTSVKLNPGTAQGAQAVSGTINLSVPADHNEVIDLTSSDPTHASVPAQVTIPAGSQSVNFTIKTVPIGTAEEVNITATPDSSSTLGAGPQSAQLTLNATPQSIVGITLNMTSLIGGSAETGAVNLIVPAATRLVIPLTSNNANVTVPKSVTVAAGRMLVPFKISTNPVASNTTATITAAFGSETASANLTVLAPTVRGFGISATSVVGPAIVTGKVAISGPAPTGGLSYKLSCSDPAAFSAPSKVTVAAGQTLANFSMNALAVSKAATVTLTLTDPITGTTFSRTLTVKP